MHGSWAGDFSTVCIDDVGLCSAAAQRGDGATTPAYRALSAAPQRLREPIREHGAGQTGAGAAADVRPASAVSADQGQAVEQAQATPAKRRRPPGGAEGPRGDRGQQL